MVFLMFAAIGGSLMTAFVMAPLGALPALVAAPFGGSLCAALAALQIARRRGAEELGGHHDIDEQTDAMVATLRGLAAQAKRWPEDGAGDRPLDPAGDRAA